MSKDPQAEMLKVLKSIDESLKTIAKQTHPRNVERERLRVEQMKRDSERRFPGYGAATFGEAEDV